MKIDGNEIKVGNILEIDNKLWKVLKTQHTQPGKGGAYIQVELKEIKEGTKMNSRFRSSETVERAILDEKKFQYLYEDTQKFFFMDQQTFEQIELGSDLIPKDQSKFLVENDNVLLQFYNEKAVGLELPSNIVLKVVETEGVVKGQTAASSYKPATLERGIKTTVPQFIDIDDKIVISTIDSSYVEKAKD
jgi:elongation factor P